MLFLSLVLLCVSNVFVGASSFCNATCAGLEHRIGVLESELTRVLEALERVEKNGVSDDLPNAYLARRQMSNSNTAFSAGIKQFDVTNLGDDATVVFDHALSNFGNAYNTATGVFTAPIKGAYFFTLTMQVSAHHSEYLELAVDGTEITDIYASADNVNDNMSTSKTWIISVEASSSVYVRTKANFNRGSLHGNMHTMFSGYLLFQL